MIDFDSVFHVIRPEQQEMVSIEEIIELQKREEAAQKDVEEKQRQLAQKACQGPPDAQGQSSAKKDKEKGITINEGAPQATQTVTSENALKSKKDEKKKVEEQAETPPATQQRTGSGGTVAMVPVSVAEVTDSRLVIHPHPFFREMISYKKDALFPNNSSATLLNNLMYPLKLARSVVFIPDRQFVLRRNMATNISNLIDLSMKVIIV